MVRPIIVASIVQGYKIVPQIMVFPSTPKLFRKCPWCPFIQLTTLIYPSFWITEQGRSRISGFISTGHIRSIVSDLDIIVDSMGGIVAALGFLWLSRGILVDIEGILAGKGALFLS